jgi:hypothetical protein
MGKTKLMIDPKNSIGDVQLGENSVSVEVHRISCKSKKDGSLKFVLRFNEIGIISIEYSNTLKRKG